MTLSPTLILGIVLFPLNVMIVIPALILWFSGKLMVFEFFIIWIISGILFIFVGLYLCWITISLFTDYGKGTPTPWAPPIILVTIGVYRYVRNPMMIGVWCVLIGEAIIFLSVGLLIWLLIFFIGSIILVQWWEEVELEKRFGDSYRQYKKEVPRWIPRGSFR